MRRAGLSEGSIGLVKRAVYAIFLSEKESATQATARLEQEHPEEPLIRELLASLRASERGRQGRAAEAVGRVR
jgi:acyl-[acyl carrier protein]--UDP-N-acetylglucosamine O-acyltransferase